MDKGERPWETAVRECQEETGLTVSGPPRLLATVYGLPGAEWPYSTIGMVFDGGRPTAAQIRGITLNPQEHDGARVLPLERCDRTTTPEQATASTRSGGPFPNWRRTAMPDGNHRA